MYHIIIDDMHRPNSLLCNNFVSFFLSVVYVCVFSFTFHSLQSLSKQGHDAIKCASAYLFLWMIKISFVHFLLSVFFFLIHVTYVHPCNEWCSSCRPASHLVGQKLKRWTLHANLSTKLFHTCHTYRHH